MKCPNCGKTEFVAISNPDCDCPDGDGGLSYNISEGSGIPCWHEHHAQCKSCGYDVGSWNNFVRSNFK